MGNFKELCSDLRKRIVDLRESGMSHGAISKLVETSECVYKYKLKGGLATSTLCGDLGKIVRHNQMVRN